MRYFLDINFRLIKNNVLKEEQEALEKANELDLELYRYVKEEVYPELIEEHARELNKIDDPELLPPDHKPVNFKASKMYNKLVYGMAEKINRKL